MSKQGKIIREYVVRVAASVEEVELIDPTDHCLILFSGPQLIVESVKFIMTSSGELHASYKNRNIIFTKPVVEQEFFLTSCAARMREAFGLGHESSEDLELSLEAFMALVNKIEEKNGKV